MKLKYNQIESLSAQQLLDCSTAYGNYGCNGGLMNYAFSYLRTTKLESWSSYPFVGYNQNCMANPSQGVVGTSGYVSLPNYSPSSLKQAVAKTPVSVAINGGDYYYQFYQGGILNSLYCGV